MEGLFNRRAQVLITDTGIKELIEAAGLRIRPIIMTSFAFVVGMIPVIRAPGPSANGNHSIGISAAGGMLSGGRPWLIHYPGLVCGFPVAAGVGGQQAQAKSRCKASIQAMNDDQRKGISSNSHGY